MKFFNKYKEKQKESRKNDINQQASSRIRLVDFNGNIFIAFDETPLVQIDNSWTQDSILNKLNELRTSFINYQIQMSGYW